MKFGLFNILNWDVLALQTPYPAKTTRLAQLHSVSHALVSTLQKHRSKTSKLLRFSSLHFRVNWGVTMHGGSYVVNLFKQKVVSQKTIVLPQ